MNTAISQLKISSAVRNGDRVNGYAIEVDTKIAVKFAATADFDRFVPDAILVVSGLFRLASEPATVGLLVRNIVAEVFIPTSYNEMDEEPQPDFDITDEPDEEIAEPDFDIPDEPDEDIAEPDFDIPDERFVDLGDSLPSGTDCAQRNLSNAPAPTPARKKRTAKSSKSDTKKPSLGKKSASLSIAA